MMSSPPRLWRWETQGSTQVSCSGPSSVRSIVCPGVKPDCSIWIIAFPRVRVLAISGATATRSDVGNHATRRWYAGLASRARTKSHQVTSSSSLSRRA